MAEQQHEEVTIDPVKLVAVKGEQQIDLSLVELRVLAFFLANKGRVVTREEIFANVWQKTADRFTNIIDVYVNYVRKKIGANIIATVRGKGYVFGQEVSA